MDSKTCSTCKEIKPLTRFSKLGTGLSPKCKDCDRAYYEANKERIKEYTAANKERRKEWRKKHYEANKERISEYNKEYRAANKELIKELAKKYYRKYPRNSKKYYEANKEKIREYNKKYYAANKHWYNGEYLRNRRKNDENFRIKGNLRRGLQRAMSAQGARKSKSTLKLVGCGIEELKQHFQSQFTDGMTWENYGEWQIDHIVPCAAFDLTDPEQQKLCFHYTNLQPLWAIDNQRKNAKLPHEFSAIQA